MSNTQLYLAVGLPMLVTASGFLTQNQKLGAFEKHVEKRLDQINSRLLAIETPCATSTRKSANTKAS